MDNNRTVYQNVTNGRSVIGTILGQYIRELQMIDLSDGSDV